LPNPKEIGNAGSFFKNPIISMEVYYDLLKRYPDIPSYPISDILVKIPAGWLIQKSGWKGRKVGNVGVHKNQALVLINYGGGTGQEIVNLALEIKKSVSAYFGVEIEAEVNII
jgi:UDP-N-acetylmuramate dehydrogenase